MNDDVPACDLYRPAAREAFRMSFDPGGNLDTVRGHRQNVQCTPDAGTSPWNSFVTPSCRGTHGRRYLHRAPHAYTCGHLPGELAR